MKSLTFRTKNEIKNGTAVKLINEIEELYTQISAKDADRFIGRLKKTAEDLPNNTSFDKKLMLSPSEKYGSSVSSLKFEKLRRQNTPKQLKQTALKCGFEHRAYYGAHPHLMDPNLNKTLPPQIFNKIS